jgi:hypothetical protein
MLVAQANRMVETASSRKEFLELDEGGFYREHPGTWTSRMAFVSKNEIRRIQNALKPSG